MKKLLTAAALAGALTMAISGASTDAQAGAKKKNMEKCYGIAKTGKNDCGANNHSCAGMAKTDSDANEWLYVPKGLCDKIVGGTTIKPEDVKKDMKEDIKKEMKK